MATQAPAKKLTLDQRVTKDPKLRARVLANAGLRSKLSTSVLRKYAPEMAKQRELNVRLRQPITPGSTVTERDLARESKSAMDVKYGDVERQNKIALDQEQARSRDLGSFYDQYLAAVRAHSANVNQIGVNAAQAGQALQAGVTGLGQQGLAMIQNPANAAAAANGVTQAGDLAPMANQALAVRQALTGSFVAQQAAQNAAQQAYADSLANVVAPGQKLGGIVQQAGKEKLAQDQITATAKQRGADTATYRSERRSDEARQVLAQQTLGAKIESDKADAAASASTKFGPGTNVPNKYGFTYDEWSKLSPKDKNDWRSGKNTRAPQKPPSTTGYGAGKTGMNEYGYTYDEWTKLPESERQKWRTGEYSKGDKPKSAQAQYEEDFFKKYGIKPVTTSESNKAKKDIGAIGPKLSALLKGKKPDGSPIKTKDGKTIKKMTPDQAGKLLSGSYDAVLVRVAMDLLKYKGFISASTANRLHHSGYSVKQLGLKTVPAASAPKTPPKKPDFNPGGSVGGFPQK